MRILFAVSIKRVLWTYHNRCCTTDLAIVEKRRSRLGCGGIDWGKIVRIWSKPESDSFELYNMCGKHLFVNDRCLSMSICRSTALNIYKNHCYISLNLPRFYILYFTNKSNTILATKSIFFCNVDKPIFTLESWLQYQCLMILLLYIFGIHIYILNFYWF